MVFGAPGAAREALLSGRGCAPHLVWSTQIVGVVWMWLPLSMVAMVFNTCFWGRPEIVHFRGLGCPGDPKSHAKMWGGAKPPIFLNGFWDPRGSPDPENGRFLAGPPIMYQQPKCVRLQGPIERPRLCSSFGLAHPDRL